MSSAEIVAIWKRLCSRCRAGFTEECYGLYDPESVCPNVLIPLEVFYAAEQAVVLAGVGVSDEPTAHPKTKNAPTPSKPRGDSGYIHPDAWPSTSDIGSFKDVTSTGPSRVPAPSAAWGSA